MYMYSCMRIYTYIYRKKGVCVIYIYRCNILWSRMGRLGFERVVLGSLGFFGEDGGMKSAEC